MTVEFFSEGLGGGLKMSDEKNLPVRYGEKELEFLKQALFSQNISPFFRNLDGGPLLQLFEKQIAEATGTSLCVAVSSGTAALHCALLTLGVGREDEVIVPSLTFSATASAVVMTGATPVFADIDPATYTISIESVKRMITPHTKAIIPVPLFGIPPLLGDFEQLGVERNIDILVDDAQSLGAKYCGKPTGSYGAAGCLSFQHTKTVSTGEGGAVCTDNPEVAEKVKRLRNHAEAYYGTDYVGWNFRMDELRAAVGLAQMERLETLLHAQKQNAQYILTHLPEGLEPPTPYSHSEPSYSLIPLRLKESSQMETILEAIAQTGVSQGQPGVNLGRGYGTPLYSKLAFASYHRDDCHNVERAVKEMLVVDIHRFRPLEAVEADWEKVCQAVRKVVK